MPDTYITEISPSRWMLVNGNSQSEEKWSGYESAVSAMSADNDLQATAIATDNPDLYHNNTQINWIS